jgi:small-conductance mechanosensitive channel
MNINSLLFLAANGEPGTAEGWSIETDPLSLIIPAGALVAGIILALAVDRILKRLKQKGTLSIRGIPPELELLRSPMLALLPAVFLAIALRFFSFPEQVAGPVKHLLNLWVIAAVAWLLIRSVGIIRQLIMSRFELDTEDNLRARQVQTQLRILSRIAIFIIVVIAGAAMLMTFEQARQAGVSLLASAGVVGIIIGFAAQKSIGTLIAGIQIAITQPIRLDDVVIVEGEWGRIEEITLTYVVVRIWDQRRLVVPITYFIDQSFQNWTRTTAELLGTVYIYADYTIPVEKVREELHRILKETEEWDERAWGLQVTNATDKIIELRALMSAADSSSAWNLRCHVREKLHGFIQSEFPESLPRARVELDRD